MRASCVRWAWVFLILIAGCGGSGGGGFSGVPAQLFPNLRPENAYDFSIDLVDTGGGTIQRVLKLSTKISNFGAGPLEIFGQIQGAPHDQIVPAFQIVHWNNGQTTVLPAGHFVYHPSHDHWHWEALADFRLAQAVNGVDPYDPANIVVASATKVSFCLLDLVKIPNFSGPGQPHSPHYDACGQNTQGISVGWSDIYGSGLPDQWIVIQGVPDGVYWVILESDPTNLLQETDETDDKSAVKVQITGNTVTVLP